MEKSNVKIIGPMRHADETGLRTVTWEVCHQGKTVATFATRKEAREAARQFREADRAE